MSLTNYQASMIIKDAEIRIANAMKETTELEPQVKEYFDAYVSLKDKLDSTRKKIDEDKALLEWASSELNDIAKGKEFRVLRSESHLDMKPREKMKLSKHKYKWTQTGIDVLFLVGYFMKEDDLWSAVCDKLEIPENERTGKLKWGSMNTCLRKSPKIFMYKDMFGLPEWKDNPGKHLRYAAAAS